MDWLFITASIITILGTLWTLFFGRRALIDIIKQKHFHIKGTTLTNLLLGIIVILLAIPLPYLPSIVKSVSRPAQNSASTPNVSPTCETPTSTQSPADQAKSVYDCIIGRITPNSGDTLDNPHSSCGWSTFNRSGTACTFPTGSYYEASSSAVNYVAECFASNMNVTNFAYEVNMNVLQGNGGGLIFRASSADFNSKMYQFDVRPERHTFDIVAQSDNSRRINPPCGPNNQEFCYNTAINLTGKNLLTVIGQDSTLYFYVNSVYLCTIKTTLSSSGVIGLFAVNAGQNTVAQFDSARLWNLK